MGSDLRYVLTIATGKKLYVDLAVNMARSFLYWHKSSDIIFQLVTDLPDLVPRDVSDKIQIITVQAGEFGLGFSPKLHLDKLVSEGQTLFIDSDCLIYGDLDEVFKKFKGHKISVAGNYISTGEWFGDIRTICKKFDIKQMPKFNGGVYYIEKGEVADRVYQTARSFEKQYDEIGFVQLRNRPNDEVLMALAMEINHQAPVTDDGSILAEFVNFQSGIKSDLLNGIAELYNDPANPAYQENWHLNIAKPVIVHFLDHHNQVMPYIKEAKQLHYLFANKLPPFAVKLLTFLQVTALFETTSYFKKKFRPLYHSLFGTRKIKTSERVIVND